MKIIVFWDIVPCSSVNVLLANCFVLVLYVANSSFLKMEAIVPVKGWRTFAERHSVTTQKIVLFML
jgi:hypothetical protein